jgi:outer membrane usher protein FimD/PapC
LQFIYNQNFTDNLSGVFQTNYNTLNFKNYISTQYNLGFNYKFIKDFYSNFYWIDTISHSSNGNGHSQSVLAQLTYFFGDGKNNIIISYNQNEGIKNYQTEYAYNENKPVNNSIYRARVSASALDNNVYLAHYHNWSKLEFGTSFDYHSQSKRREININPLGSISFINGKFGLGPRINQAFVMIDNELEERVVVNGDQDNYEAKLEPHDRVVLAGVQPYVAKRLSVISDENKLSGFSNSEYRTMAYYKSGSYLKLSLASNRSVVGHLVDEKGKAYSLSGAKMINLSSGEETLFFTNRDGSFFIENIKPENYQIIVIDRGQLRSNMINLNNRLNEEKNNLGKITINRK